MAARKPQGLTALKSYASKYTKRKKLEEEIEKLKADLKTLETPVLKYFEKHGVDRQAIGGYTVAPRLELWAGRNSELTQEDIHNALIDAGLPDYATKNMNHQGMSAYVREIYRELIEAENAKPKEQQRLIDKQILLEEIFARHPELEGKLEVREELKISVTKSRQSSARKRIKDVLASKDALPKDLAEDEIR